MTNSQFSLFSIFTYLSIEDCILSIEHSGKARPKSSIFMTNFQFSLFSIFTYLSVEDCILSIEHSGKARP